MNMLRVHYSKLETKQGVLFFQGRAFTGLAYRFTPDHVLERVLIVRDGQVESESRDLVYMHDPLNPTDKIHLRVDMAALEEDEAYDLTSQRAYRWHGAPFIGFAYTFTDDGFLTDEEEFAPEVHGGREWYPSGQICSDSYAEGIPHWYENGQLSTYSMSTYSGRIGSLSFVENGDLERLSLTKEVDTKRSRLVCYTLNRLLTLYGDGINDAYLPTLSQHADFKQLTRLKLDVTRITDAALLAVDFGHMHLLNLHDNDFISPQAARKIKKKYPQCKVKFYKEGVDDDKIEPTLRLHHRQTATVASLLCHGGTPFTGYVYRFNEKRELTGLLDVEAGRVLGEATDVLAPLGAYRHVEINRLTPVATAVGEERYLLDGADFHGVAYAFNEQGFLAGEHFFNAKLDSLREWYPDGQIKRLDTPDTEKHWEETGDLTKVGYCKNGVPVLTFEFTSIYLLGLFLARGADFQLTKLYSYQSFGEDFYLEGDGIDDLVVKIILRPSVNFDAKNLLLKRTKVSDRGMEAMYLRRDLKELAMEENEYITLDMAKKIKREHPELKVTFNGASIE